MGIFNNDDAAATTTTSGAASSSTSSSSGSSKSCPALPSPVYDAAPIVGDMTFQELSKIIGGACAALALLCSVLLILLHATHFSNKAEQTKIIRIISIISFFVIIAFVNIVIGTEAAVYVQPWMEAYEAIALCSFFLLLCTYISPLAHKQEEYFASSKGGLGAWKKTWVAIFQYPVVAILVAAFTDITNAAGVFCIESNSPRFAHIWLQIIRVISVGVAVISILRFTKQLRSQLKHNHVFMKFFAFKGIVFVTTFQTAGFSFAAGKINPTDRLSYNDIANVLPNLLICIEMALFSLFFLFAYTHRPYVLRGKIVEHGSPVAQRRYEGGFLGIKALFSALNPSEILVGIVTAVKLFMGSRGSPQPRDIDLREGRFRGNQGQRGRYEPVHGNAQYGSGEYGNTQYGNTHSGA